MKSLLTKLILLMPFIFSASVQSEMYKWVDDEGNINYSDRPPFNNADTHVSPEINTTPAIKVPEKPPQAPEESTKETVYQFFKITAPEQNATIRDNQGDFAISLAIQPDLNTARGDYITVLLDNKIAQDNLTSLSAQFNNADRGVHQISALIKNKQGKTLFSTKSISINMHRASVLNPSPSLNP